jgi:murein DD-endopeptidase MepM/ murein hydrolase activator NlpD
VVSPGRSAVRVATPGHQPIGLSRRDDKPSAAVANRNSNAVPNRANLRRGNLTVTTRGPPAQPAPKAAAKTPSADTRTADATPTFQWPVHGKILARFGPQPNGEKNYGVTIAVPQDTPIKSAEDGVVIYAGSGLKGFGNLVLVRHANHYVTAYAHAKELRVRRGDQIKRGDVIAASGQTGNVSTPQLYFEVRKSSAPVDPLRLLHGQTKEVQPLGSANKIKDLRVLRERGSKIGPISPSGANGDNPAQDRPGFAGDRRDVRKNSWTTGEAIRGDVQT